MMNMSVTAGIDLYLRKHPNLAESSVAIKSRAAGAPIESVRDYQDRHFLKNVVVVQGGESCRDCFYELSRAVGEWVMYLRVWGLDKHNVPCFYELCEAGGVAASGSRASEQVSSAKVGSESGAGIGCSCPASYY